MLECLHSTLPCQVSKNGEAAMSLRTSCALAKILRRNKPNKRVALQFMAQLVYLAELASEAIASPQLRQQLLDKESCSMES